MTTSLQSAIDSLLTYVPFLEKREVLYSNIFKQHQHRIYSLAFWMTDDELMAEKLSANTFLRVFAAAEQPTAEQVDRAFLAEAREWTSLGSLTLNCQASPDLPSLYGTMKRVHLERAVMELPATERLIFLMHDAEGYEHARIARLLGITEAESQFGLHQARLRI